jgi:FdhD protein
MMDVKLKINRISPQKDNLEYVKDYVALEENLKLYINQRYYATFSFSPEDEYELILGHLFVKRIISDCHNIAKIRISKGKAYVKLNFEVNLEHYRKSYYIDISCEGTTMNIDPFHLIRSKIKKSKMTIAPKIVQRALDEFNSSAVIFKKTGGTHASAIFSEKGEKLFFSEDIGRNNAIDKVIGKALRAQVELKGTILASTGRLTSQIVAKAVNTEIATLISMSAPTNLGVKLAETAGILLIGFARAKRFNVYTYPERILT